MNQRTSRLLLSAAFVLLSGCSDDDGANVEPKPPVNNAGAGGSGGDSGSGGNGGAGGSGDLDASAGGSAGEAPVDAGFPPCVPSTDAGVSADAGDAGDLSDAGDAGEVAAPLVSYETQLYPVFRARCAPCHETDKAGGHNIASVDLNESYRDARNLGSSLPQRVNEGGMPPSYSMPPNNCDGPLGSPGCVSVEEFDLIQRWIGQCYPR
jgi:hypothetical protein